MLLGDIIIGRFVHSAVRDRLVIPLRVLLAAPFLVFWVHPPLAWACLLAAVGAFGYSAALPVQERLVGHTPGDARGQVLGLAGTGLMLGQAVGALVAGAVAQRLGAGSAAAGHAMLVMAVLSLGATLLISRGFRRSGPLPAEAAQPAR